MCPKRPSYELRPMTKPSANSCRRNYICNFRAPDSKHHRVWLDFKQEARGRGLDICYLILSLCQSWLKAVESVSSTTQIVTSLQVINLQQQNTFVYSVQKPRRDPHQLFCSRESYNRTIRSLAFQAYVVEKARDLNRSFMFRTFSELGHDLFRKCILDLKRRGKVLPLEPRTNPRFYILSEWRERYPTMLENITIKPGFTGDRARRSV